MTAAEMHIAFKLGLDKVASFAYPNFLSQEVDFFLNQAQLRVIKQRYDGNNQKREAFEETQKRVDDLRTLVKVDSTLPVLVTTPRRRYRYTLPNDYMFGIMYDGSITKTGCAERDMYIKQVQHDDLINLLQDPFNNPLDEWSLLVYENTYIYLYVDSTWTVSAFNLTYLKTPVSINGSVAPNVDSELPSQIHQEIVDEAVLIAIENIESSRIQTNGGLINRQE